MNVLINTADQQLLPAPGGVMVRNDNNQAIGSVGITVDLSDEDKHCAVTGTQAASLAADTGK